MSQLRLEHVNFNELPPKWAKQLPPAQTVTVTIVVENLPPVNTDPPSTNDNQEAYLQHLYSQGINIKRLDDSIKQLETGESEIVKLDDLDNLLDNFIENAKTENNTKCYHDAYWKQTDSRRYNEEKVMLHNYTAKYTKVDSGYMGQLVEWPEIITEGTNLDECRAMLKDALHEMVLAYQMQNQEIPLGNGLIEHLPVEINDVCQAA